MVSRIGSSDAAARWAAHIAVSRLRMDTQRLTADLAAEADPQVIAADRAAVVQSRSRVGAHMVDVTV